MCRIHYSCKKGIKEYEIIIAIGCPNNWGKKIAHHAILSILNEVFFKWRINKLLSKVHIDNVRSINLFKHLGFKETITKNNHIIFAITFDEYFSYLKIIKNKPSSKQSLVFIIT